MRKSLLQKRLIALLLAVVLIISITLTAWLTAKYTTIKRDDISASEAEIAKYKKSCQSKITTKDYEGALKDINSAINQDKSDEELYVIRASIYVYLTEYINAIKDYKKAIAINPKLTSLYETIARLYYDLDNTKEALIYFQKALEFDAANTELIKMCLTLHDALGDKENALTDVLQLIKLDTKNPTLYCAAADYQVHFESYQDAITNYQTALNYYDVSVDSETIIAIYYALGSCYVQTKAYEDAINYFTKYIENAIPTYINYNIDACIQRAISYYNIGLYQEASSDFYNYFEVYPNDSNYWIYLAKCYYFSSDINNSIIWFEKCEKSNISYAESNYFLADIRLNRNEYELAILSYNACIAQNYSKDICHFNRGISFLSLGDYANAKSDFEIVIQITKDPTLKAEAENMLSQLNY